MSRLDSDPMEEMDLNQIILEQGYVVKKNPKQNKAINNSQK